MCLSGLAACLPEPGEPASRIRQPRVLAVRSEPAEAAPGAGVALTVLFATPAGAAVPGDVEWAFCTAPKPPVERNAVADACLGDATQAIPGRDAQIAATIPGDACLLFGPEVPPTPVGQPPARPRDPDATGGYYQPVRVRVESWPGQATPQGQGAAPAIALPRIQCGLAGASAEVAAAYRDRYPVNRNPRLAAVRISDGAQPLLADALPVGRTLQVHIDVAADAAEPFPLLDPATQALIDARETLQVSWFATAGSFALGRTLMSAGVDAGADNSWQAPDAATAATMWIVLRDSRGGVDWLTVPVQAR